MEFFVSGLDCSRGDENVGIMMRTMIRATTVGHLDAGHVHVFPRLFQPWPSTLSGVDVDIPGLFRGKKWARCCCLDHFGWCFHDYVVVTRDRWCTRGGRRARGRGRGHCPPHACRRTMTFTLHTLFWLWLWQRLFTENWLRRTQMRRDGRRRGHRGRFATRRRGWKSGHVSHDDLLVRVNVNDRVLR